ncbi:MAG: histidine kinase dimerization/phospho-acceptor domain-containing protein [Pseudomonadota bacterium]
MTRAAAVRAHMCRAPIHLDKTMPPVQSDALQDLAHQICHELRTPLNAVIGFSDLMRQELFGPVGSSHYREYLDHINESAQRMLQAAEETLSLTSQLAAPRFPETAKPFNLFAAVHQAAIRAVDEVGRDQACVQLKIAQSIEVWGRDENVITGLTYLLRAFLLNTSADTSTIITTQRASSERLTLIMYSSDMYSSDKAGNEPSSGCLAAHARRKQADAALLSALAVSLFKMQGLEVILEDCEASGDMISIELELSAQQAFTL